MENSKAVDAYSAFAKVYDLFMDDVPYEGWSGYLIELLKKYHIQDGLILDLACGTGQMTRLLKKAGYEMIGIDFSAEMLMCAMEASKGYDDILYLMQDMCEFELYGTVRAVVCVCDSINYLLEEEELLRVFTLVNNYLDPRGIFIFDINTIFKYEQLMGEQIFSESKEAGSYIWENYYDSETQINEYKLTLFVKEEEELFRKYQEIHYQRGYTLETMISLLEQAGLLFIAAYDANTKEAPGADSERIFLIAGEQGK